MRVKNTKKKKYNKTSKQYIINIQETYASRKLMILSFKLGYTKIEK